MSNDICTYIVGRVQRGVHRGRQIPLLLWAGMT